MGPISQSAQMRNFILSTLFVKPIFSNVIISLINQKFSTTSTFVSVSLTFINGNGKALLNATQVRFFRILLWHIWHSISLELNFVTESTISFSLLSSILSLICKLYNYTDLQLYFFTAISLHMLLQLMKKEILFELDITDYSHGNWDSNNLQKQASRDVLKKICSKFTGEHPCRSVISLKLQSNFVEIALRGVLL